MTDARGDGKNAEQHRNAEQDYPSQGIAEAGAGYGRSKNRRGIKIRSSSNDPRQGSGGPAFEGSRGGVARACRGFGQMTDPHAKVIRFTLLEAAAAQAVDRCGNGMGFVAKA